MTNLRAAVFDLDGTLLNTLRDLAASGNEMLRSAGYPVHPEEDYRVHVGDGARTLIQRILPASAAADDDEVERCLAIYLAIYARRWDETTHPYPGIPELLTALGERGIRLAVLSNKPHDATRQCVKRFLGDWEWEVIQGQRDGIPKKPDPAGLKDILAQLNVSAAETLYLGDTNVDMQTATAARVRSVGVLWGFRDRAELEQNGAGILIETPLDLITHLSTPGAAPSE